jgi:hypothetical protein
MRLLAGALVILGTTLAAPTFASSDVSADRHYAATERSRRAASSEVQVQTKVTSEASTPRARNCACARGPAPATAPAR